MLPLAYPHNANRASDYACIVFIFIYALGYSMGFGPAAWVYGSEVRFFSLSSTPVRRSTPTDIFVTLKIFPTAVRARGLNFAASGGAIGSIAVAQIWPVGIDRVGSRIYFFFMAVNLVCVPVIWLLYPETKARSLEDMDVLFGAKGVSGGREYGEADNLHGGKIRPTGGGPGCAVARERAAGVGVRDGTQTGVHVGLAISDLGLRKQWIFPRLWCGQAYLRCICTTCASN